MGFGQSNSLCLAGFGKMTSISPLLNETAMKKRTAIKTELFAEQHHRD
jgi:hypothetical protein